MNQAFFNRLLHLLNDRPEQGKLIVGLESNAVWELWQGIAAAEREERLKQAQSPERKRQAGGGHKQETNVLCRLLVTLFYLRQHWTMQAISETIGCAESTVRNYIHEILPHLRAQLPESLLKQWKQEFSSVERAELEQWLAELPEGELLLDTWEQPIPRPSDNQKQEEYYSEKMKEPTVTNQVITLPNGVDIVDVVIGENVSRSDSQLFEQTQSELPESFALIGDKACVGYRNTTTANRNPPKGELTQLAVRKVKEMAEPIATYVVSSSPGRVRLRVNPIQCRHARMQSITDALEEHPQVNRVRANLQTGSILIHHDREDGSLESVFATLADIGMIVGGIAVNEIPEPEGHSEAASSVADAIADLDQRVRRATNGLVDLRFLFPLGLALLAIRQLRAKGLQLDIVPWYVLAWYAFDSFMKLHYTRSLPPPRKKALSD